MHIIVSERDLSPKSALRKIWESLGYEYHFVAGASSTSYNPVVSEGFEEITAGWAGSEGYQGAPAINGKDACEGWRTLPGTAGRSWNADLYWLVDPASPGRLAEGKPKFVLANPCGSWASPEAALAETFVVVEPGFPPEQIDRIRALCESAEKWW